VNQLSVSVKNRFGFFRFFEIQVKMSANIHDFPLFPASIKKITPAAKRGKLGSQEAGKMKIE
jgi:hypothetical protein